jgi:hypothetical protein
MKVYSLSSKKKKKEISIPVILCILVITALTIANSINYIATLILVVTTLLFYVLIILNFKGTIIVSSQYIIIEKLLSYKLINKNKVVNYEYNKNNKSLSILTLSDNKHNKYKHNLKNHLQVEDIISDLDESLKK